VDRHTPVSTQVANVIAVFVPLIGFIVAAILLWGWGFDWLHAAIFLGMYLVSAVGITVGYHRYFCHRSFRTYRTVQFLLAVFGAMAFEGPVLKWVAMHRCHHRHSDQPGDPHSPHLHGQGIWAMLRGMFHAHVGWIFNTDPKNLVRFIPDLQSDPMVRWLSRSWVLWAGLGLLVPSLVGGLISMSWTGALLGFLWGGLARVFLVHHITWSVNSICHFWGAQPFRSHDHSRNNFLFGVLAMGEGWHNNHHAFPRSARHGLQWWQIDFSYWLIVALSRIGLAWNVKVPESSRIAAKAAC
jgi:stearoyl-CoA desaturase (delta-9 desaturase)